MLSALAEKYRGHLSELNFPSEVGNNYVKDVFGWAGRDGTYHEGLVDCEDQVSFFENLGILKNKWDDLEAEAFSDRTFHEPNFHSWFVCNKADKFSKCTLRSMRESVGLGSLPAAFYTNDSESINAFLKDSVGYKKSQWGLFNEKMKKIVKQRQCEMEKAIIGLGEYKMRSKYSFLKVPEEKWFCMTEEQRLCSLKKLILPPPIPCSHHRTKT